MDNASELRYHLVSNDCCVLRAVFDCDKAEAYYPVYDIIGALFGESDEGVVKIKWKEFITSKDGKKYCWALRSLVQRTIDGVLTRTVLLEHDAACSLIKFFACPKSWKMVDELNEGFSNLFYRNSSDIVITPNGFAVVEGLIWKSDEDIDQLSEGDVILGDYVTARYADGDIWFTRNELSDLFGIDKEEVSGYFNVETMRQLGSSPLAARARLISKETDEEVFGLALTLPLLFRSVDRDALRFRKWVKGCHQMLGAKAHIVDWNLYYEFCEQCTFERMWSFDDCRRRIDLMAKQYLFTEKQQRLNIWYEDDPDLLCLQGLLLEAMFQYTISNTRLLYTGRRNTGSFSECYCGFSLGEIKEDIIYVYSRARNCGSSYAKYRLSCFYRLLSECCKDSELEAHCGCFNPTYKSMYDEKSCKLMAACVKDREPHALLDYCQQLWSKSSDAANKEAGKYLKIAASSGYPDAMFEYARRAEDCPSEKPRAWYNAALLYGDIRRRKQMEIDRWLERVAESFICSDEEDDLCEKMEVDDICGEVDMPCEECLLADEL